MIREKKLLYNMEIQAIPRLRDDLDRLQMEWELPEAERHQLVLIVEELFSRLARNRSMPDMESSVGIYISMVEQEIVIIFTYGGFAFNPMDQKKGTGLGFEEEEDDNMGPDLVRTFAFFIGYQHSDSMNRLEIRKKIRAKPEIATDE
jgi:anti-sigma regulatory factor (Ser/Thr protein kinase)